MRHTYLQFVQPAESSPNPRIPMVTKEGINMDYSRNTSKQQNGRRTTFSHEPRFKDAKLYSIQTGSSVFLGPGTYKPEANFIAQNRAFGLAQGKLVKKSGQDITHLYARWTPLFSNHMTFSQLSPSKWDYHAFQGQ